MSPASLPQHQPVNTVFRELDTRPFAISENLPVTDISYISFTRANKKQGNKCKKDLISYLKHSDDSWYQEIGNLFDNNFTCRGIRTTVDMDDKNRIAVIHLIGENDRNLIQLAKKLNDYPMSFPRGFAFLFDTQEQKVIGLSAFYPKFDNDDKQDNFSQTEFANDSSLDLHIKYSGFLGKVVFFEHPDHGLSYSAFSKNSASSYNSDGTQNHKSMCPKVHDAVKGSLGRETINNLWDQGIRGICCEVMSTDDQVHGYGYRETGFVVTALSKDDHTFCTPRELYDICFANNLPADPPIHLDQTNLQPFISDLIEVRDLLTYPQLQKLYAKYKLQEGSLHKRLIDSDIVEGFVIRRPDGTRVKFKCWPYVMSTMVLRNYLVGNNLQNQNTSKPLNKPDGTMQDELKKLFESNLNHWVSSRNQVVRNLARWLFQSSIEEEKRQHTVKTGRPPWIALPEIVMTRFSNLLEQNDFDLQKVHSALQKEQHFSSPSETRLTERTIVLVIGPIGYGKSTFAQKLADSNPDFKHIDGDDLGLGVGVTKNLRNKRNLITCATVHSALLSHRTPVLSTGGGAILYDPQNRRDETPYLQTFLSRVGIKANFKIMVPGESYNCQNYSTEDIHSAYEDEKSVESTVTWRKDQKAIGWEEQGLSQVIKKNKNNFDICQKLLGSTPIENVYSYPRCIEGSPPDVEFSQVVIDLTGKAYEPPLPLTSVRAKAIQQYYTAAPATIISQAEITPKESRARIAKDMLLHRTMEYSQKSIDIPLPVIPETEPGKTRTGQFTGIFDNKTNQLLCSFIHMPELASSAHLTVDNGQFNAKDMSVFAEALANGKTTVNIARKGEDNIIPISFRSQQQEIEVTARHVVALNEF